MGIARYLSKLASGLSSEGVLSAAKGGTGTTTGGGGSGSGGPKISSIVVTNSSYTNLDDTAVDIAGGYIKIIGSGFETGCQVLIGSTLATSVTFVSATEVRAQVPATAAGTYIVYLVNSDGGTAIRVNGITFSTTPTWTSTSPITGIVNTAISVQLTATGASTFSVVAGSTLPAGLALSSSGLLSGTITGITDDTTYNFTILATDTELQDSPQTFALNINAARDPYFNYATLLLQGATTTFVDDASTNNFAVTVAGDTKPNSFNPYTPGYYSNYFDGTGDYLATATSSAFTFGTGDLTLECWIYPTATSVSTYRVIFADNVYGSAGGYTLYSYNNALNLWKGGSGGVEVIAPAGTFTLNSWTHVAWTRSGSSNRLFINGVQVGATTTDATDYISTASYIGASQAGTFAFAGYISNARIVKGTAVYTSNFTPSTTPLTAISGTSLLTCQSNRFIDNSTNNLTITRNGDTSIKSFTPFVPNASYSTYGSGYFDGTGDYLSATGTGLNLVSSDFTIEAWVYLTSGSTYQFLIGSSDNAAGYMMIGINVPLSPTSTIAIGRSGISWPVQFGAGITFTSNTWTHIAVTRSGTTNRAFINGVQLGSNVTDSTSWSFPSNTMWIGNQTGGTAFNGHITDVRIVNGTAVYTSNFTPPTAPLTAITNTSLLTLQNNQPTNNSTFLDSSSNNFNITRVGNPTQGSFSPYSGNWSTYFDGNGDYLAATSPSMSGTWTIELWWYPTVSGVQQTFVSYNAGTNGSLGTIGMNIWMNTSNQLVVDNGQVASGLFTGGTFTINAWNHVAVVRNGTTTTGYINGAVVGSNTFTPGSVNQINIGRYPDGNATTFYYASGYISNLRVVTGTAVYTSAFTPPTSQLTAISGTQLLTCQNNRFVDNSTNNYTITRGGDTKVQRFSPFSFNTSYSTSTIGGSGYFDGSGDYLTIPSNPAFQITGDFTIEAYVYATSLGTWNNIASQGASNNNFACGYNSSSGWHFNYGNNATDVINTRTGPSPLNAWTHVAYVKSGTTMTIYVNGTALSPTITVPDLPLFSGALHVGIWAGVPDSPWIGYISNLRIVKGTAVYTTNFTPPTAPVTAVVNTSLLCNFTSASIVDGTMVHDLETVGDAKLSTALSKFGGTSMSFDGTGDYLTVSPNVTNNLGTGDFTIEMWTYNTGNIGNLSLFYKASSFELKLDASRWVWQVLPSTNVFVTNGTLTANTWVHVALVRNGATTTLYLNGTSYTSGGSANAVSNTNPLQIGSGAGGTFTGYIDDFRITKGYARYTSNFTPPAIAHFDK